MIESLQEWFRDHQGLFWVLTALSVATAVGTVAGVGFVITRMPADYFSRDCQPASARRHPVLRLIGLISKNLLGVVLVAAGIAMLVLPGQGVLTILIGLTLLNFPGKRKLELWVVRRSAVLRTINWMRRKASRPPLEIPQPEYPGTTDPPV